MMTISVEYDPFKHRAVAHPTSTLGAFFHLLKSSLGSGLLAMPAAFKHAGIIVGFVGTFVLACVATHCVHILVKTSRDMCKEVKSPLMSYTETCETVFKNGPKSLQRFSKFVRHTVDFTMAGVCLGGTSVYVIFIASSIKDLCDEFRPDYKLSIKLYCLMLSIPLLLIVQIKHLKFLIPFSVFANICLVATVCIACYFCSIDIPDIKERHLIANVQQWPLFISTAIFAMEGINVVMPVENEMAHPEYFLGCPGVLNVTMIFVAILYAFVGLMGYIKYGEHVRGSLTLNLPQNNPLAITATTLVAIAVLATYCLQMYAPIDIAWTRLKRKINLKYHKVGQILLRIIYVLCTVFLAIAVPDLEILIGLVGAIFFSTLGIFIPAIIELVFKWERGLGCYYWVLWKDIVLIIFYILVLVSGLYASIREICIRFDFI